MTRLTHWMQRYILFSWAIIAAAALVASYWALDRTPPFILSSYTVFNARAGETAFINAVVDRNVGRNCNVTFSRYLVDAQRIRHDIGGTQYMTSAALHQMERDTPDSLRLAVKIPSDTPVGTANLVTALEYRCNPTHAIWPMDVLLEMDLEVLP